MNPKNSELPSPNLEVGAAEQLPNVENNAEKVVAAPEKAGNKTTPVVISTDQQQAASDVAAAEAVSKNDSATDASATTTNVVQNVKDDGDLIEKEWVDKAKQIVEKTRSDPYKQSEELTVMKADYMKKRYGKDIKVDK
ncbi:MAG: hypothetical protein WCK80_03035 [bacterium]